jgi:hypothetical protein
MGIFKFHKICLEQPRFLWRFIIDQKKEPKSGNTIMFVFMEEIILIN